MATYTIYSLDWLQDPSSIKIVLVVASVYNVVTNTVNTLYWGNQSYTVSDGSVSFTGLIRRSVQLNETLSPEGTGAITFGDLELSNPNGELDDYLDSSKYIWSNQPLKIYYGDPQWNCTTLADLQSKFTLVFNGVIDDVDSRARVSLNLKIRDNLERLNTPLTEDKLGTYGTWPGVQQNQDQIKPVVFGEVFNITPLSIDPSLFKYQFNNGPSEALIEVRDNGSPYTLTLVTGLTLTPTVTATGAVAVNSATTITTGGSGYVVGDQVYLVDSSNQPALFTVGVTTITSTLVVGTVTAGVIGIGMTLVGSNVTAVPLNTTIVSQVSGTPGGAGTYTVSTPLSIQANSSITGTNAVAIYTVSAVTAGVVTGGSITTAGTGYTAGVKTAGLFKHSVSRIFQGTVLYDPAVSIFTTGYAARGTVTCSVQGVKKSLNTSTGALTTTYSNSLGNILGLIATQYGKANTRLTAADLDMSSLNLFTVAVGTVVTDTANVLNVARQLTSSIGAQLFINRSGVLQMLQYGTPYNTGAVITNITEADILYNSLAISTRPEVIGTVKIGYAKNYTIQANLLGAIPQAHKDTMADAWVSNTKTNQYVIDKYKLAQDAKQVDTQLIESAAADTEADRRLSLWSAQHFVFKFTATSGMLALRLGQGVNLIHSRFNLYNSGSGRAGQVVGLYPNWTAGTVDVEVFI